MRASLKLFQIGWARAIRPMPVRTPRSGGGAVDGPIHNAARQHIIGAEPIDPIDLTCIEELSHGESVQVEMFVKRSLDRVGGYAVEHSLRAATDVVRDRTNTLHQV